MIHGKTQNLSKAYLCANFEEFYQVYQRVKEIETRLLVQEFIPGDDANVHYCLMYRSKYSGKTLQFTGEKIRQWPVRTGSTAITKPLTNSWIAEDSLRLFEQTNVYGFGSVEYKKHNVTGKYYITEPTIGRMNLQEFVATVNGVNLPLFAYEHLTGETFTVKSNHSQNSVIYIDELGEARSSWQLWKEKKLSFRSWRQSRKGKKIYRYFSSKDPWVGLMFIWKYLGKIVKKEN